MSEPTKPCELPCPKCGSDDVYRRFVEMGSLMETAKYDKSPSKYASGQGFSWKAERDHLTHNCRCCGYLWATTPMKKQRAEAAA